MVDGARSHRLVPGVATGAIPGSTDAGLSVAVDFLRKHVLGMAAVEIEAL
jgi:hypothetical protein